MKRAFIYRRGGLGDTLLVFPIFEILKREGFFITASGNRDYLKLALEVGWIDKIVSPVLDGEVEPPENFMIFHGETYDLRIIIGINGNIHPFPADREWIVEYYLRSLGLWEKSFSRILPVERIDPVKIGVQGFKSSKVQEFKAPEVLIAPSSGSRKKNFPPELIFAMKEIFPESVVIAGEADMWLKRYVEPVYLDTDIVKTALFLKEARLFIGADSGLSHLSAYLGVPTMIIYGPTDPVVWRPIGEKIVQIRPSGCPPCFPDGCEERRCLEDRKIIDKVSSLVSFFKVQGLNLFKVQEFKG